MSDPEKMWTVTAEEQQLIDIIKEYGNNPTDLILKYRFNKLYRIAYNILDSHKEAEMVAQEVLFQAYKDPAEFKGDSLFLTWLSRKAIDASFARKKSMDRASDKDKGESPDRGNRGNNGRRGVF